jgi:hypothetical protein
VNDQRIQALRQLSARTSTGARQDTAALRPHASAFQYPKTAHVLLGLQVGVTNTKRQKSYANDFVDSLNNAAPAIVASASCMVEYPAAVIHIALCKLLGAPCILVLAY